MGTELELSKPPHGEMIAPKGSGDASISSALLEATRQYLYNQQHTSINSETASAVDFVRFEETLIHSLHVVPWCPYSSFCTRAHVSFANTDVISNVLQELECQIVPFRSEHLRITIQGGGECGGRIFVDAVELFHGGPTPAERAVSSVVGFMDEPRLMPSKASKR